MDDNIEITENTTDPTSELAVLAQAGILAMRNHPNATARDRLYVVISRPSEEDHVAAKHGTAIEHPDQPEDNPVDHDQAMSDIIALQRLIAKFTPHLKVVVYKLRGF